MINNQDENREISAPLRCGRFDKNENKLNKSSMNLSKFVLSLVAMILIGWIGKDAYYISAAKKGSENKMAYLDTLHPKAEIDKLMASIKESSEMKASLEKYFNRASAVYNTNTTFSDSIVWDKYIDPLDLQAFQKEIGEIPKQTNDSNIRLNTVRNKMTHNILQNYFAAKVGTGYAYTCMEDYNFVLDKNNNIVIYENKCPDMQRTTTINGVQPTHDYNLIIKIPIADTLNIKTKYYQKISYKQTETDTFETTHIIDVAHLPN